MSIGAPVLWTINGSEVAFPKATPRDYIEMGDLVYARLRADLLADLEASGVTDAAYRFEKLTELREQKGLGGTAIRWLFTTEGASEMIRRSLARAGNGLTVEALGLNEYQLHELAMAIGCVQIKETGETGDDADPTKAANSAATGGTNPA